MFTISITSQIGDLNLEFDKKNLLSLSIADKVQVDKPPELLNKGLNSPKVKLVRDKITQYFIASVAFQSIQLAPKGTLFQQSVWNELIKIPLGETRTYGEIANTLNSSARAVGNACRKNPIQIIIPCHRVISANGIGGYAGKTEGRQLDIKRWLLKHEGVEL